MTLECPACGSTAVVARTYVDDYVNLLQSGVDPYDLICGDKAQAECKACGLIFFPVQETVVRPAD
ncbi:MAG: hypothetical protein AB1641_25995 [Thermodesulfobacteriota bacterium]